MPIQYENVVPWGRSFDEYVRMFSLNNADLSKNILGCGDGPADFNRHLFEAGGRCVSVDPIYAFSKAQIQERIDDTFHHVIAQTRANTHRFIWDHIKSVTALGEIRMSAMQRFLTDYDKGKTEHRYVEAELPSLPFADDAFDLALSSHFLFLYSEHLSLDFHNASILEMLRVAPEIRIFPLVDLNAIQSSHLLSVLTFLQREGFNTRIQRVDYEFQKGGNEQLIVSRST